MIELIDLNGLLAEALAKNILKASSQGTWEPYS